MSDSARYRLSWVLCLLAIVGSLCQVSVGAKYSGTGELISGGLPISTLILFVCGLPLILLNFRKEERPGISIVHGLFLLVLSVSLLGLSALSSSLAVRKLVQIYEILGFSYVVFLINRKLLLDVLEKSSSAIVIVLLLLHARQLNDPLPLQLSDTKLEAIVVLLTPFILRNLVDASLTVRVVVLWTVCLLSGLSFVSGGLLLCYLIVFALSGLAFLRPRPVIAVYAVLTVACSLLPLGPKTAWSSLDPAYDAVHTKRLFIEYKASLNAPAHFPLGIGPGQYKEGINYLKGMQSLTPHRRDLKIPRDSNSQYQIYLVESGPLAVAGLIACLFYLVGVSLKTEDRDDRYLRLL